VQSVELTVSADPEKGMRSAPRMLRTMSCRPRFEGRWTQLFDDEARVRSTSRLFEVVKGAKIDGFPAYAFAVPERVLGDRVSTIPPQQWMLHLPGRFVYGSGLPAEMGSIDAAPVRDDAELCLEMDLEAYVEMFTQMGGAAPREFAALGFDKLKRLKWSLRFVGELLHDVVEIQLDGEPGGLVGALLNARSPLPDQALPDGALVQLRAAVDLTTAVAELAKIDNDLVLPEPLRELVLAAFDGGLAVSCCAPPPGGLIPRIFVTANVRDGEAFDRLLATLITEGAPVKKLTFGDVEVSTLKIPDAPQGLQPAWCRVGDKLHVAESARSMRAFLKAQRGAAVAMPVGDLQAPDGPGELLPTLDLRFDAAAIYENFYEHWLPLYELSGVADLPPPVRRRDLPEPEVVAEHLGFGRGVLRRDGDRYSLIQASGSGGIEITALLFTWSTMISPMMHDYYTEHLSLALARDKLSRVQAALDAFRQREQRLPKDLAELFAAAQLPDDALLMPYDDLAEEVVLPDGRKVRSSFRYYPQGVAYRGTPGNPTVRLIEIRTHMFNRAVLDIAGEVPESFGPDCRKPIEQFGG
ncbi:MAG: hypothetical protein KAI24_06340, partial [Planctomycetes bacterium]|nr:hypothetical protein [Planctomycetota bacterium]